MSTTSAAQLAWLRVQFPDWRTIRTECGTYIARHRLTGDRVQSRELADQAVAGEVLGQLGSRRGRALTSAVSHPVDARGPDSRQPTAFSPQM
ncbi:MAG TPA: hypothetical protein VIV12_22035 [Streptosporangiaceae bacterium]